MTDEDRMVMEINKLGNELCNHLIIISEEWSLAKVKFAPEIKSRLSLVIETAVANFTGRALASAVCTLELDKKDSNDYFVAHIKHERMAFDSCVKMLKEWRLIAVEKEKSAAH